jgi:hypothetical protein
MTAQHPLPASHDVPIIDIRKRDVSSTSSSVNREDMVLLAEG